MDIANLIKKRRAYRAFEKVTIPETLFKEAARLAQLAPSCMNKQPWNYVIIQEPNHLSAIVETMSSGNKVWNRNSSAVIAVVTKTELDCEIGPKKERKYYLFDTGLATAFLILFLTENNLVAHPMAGFNPEKAKEVLGIPEDMEIVVLIGIGKKTEKIPDDFSENQKKNERERPARKALDEFLYFNRFG
ncbi:nitroreductase family protein [Candidatus Hodarchaeum mangrovi]